MIINFLTMFAVLMFAHYVADYPLQGEFLARAKNHTNPVDHVPWQQALFAHSTIHAGMVYLITGSMALALCELCLHARIDYKKCAGEITFNQDQAYHLIAKLVWAAVAVFVL